MSTLKSLTRSSPLQTGGTAHVPPELILLFGRHVEVIEKVGHGGKSIVYLCRNSTPPIEHLPSQFAVKRMYFPIGMEAQAQGEMDLLRDLHSTCIVKYYDGEVARHRDSLCVSIVLEYCPDSLLRHTGVVGTRKLHVPEGTIFHLACCVADGLAFLHSRSPPVAHRDVKVENILIGADGMFKLCDFGSATTTASQCATASEANAVAEEASRFTTLAYRAPEMCDPFLKHRIDEQVDVWAFGVLLYFVMYTRFPFAETNLAILNGSVAFDESDDELLQSRYSAPLRTLVERCLTKDPKARWTSFDIVHFLKHDLSVHAAAPRCAEFPFETPARPSDWEPQPLSTRGGSRQAPAKTTGGSLFAQLHWQKAEPSVVSAAPLTTAPSVQSQSMLAPATSTLDDLFSWQPSSAPTPQQVSSNLFDDFFKPA